jgi:hypothetical protein
MLLVGIMKPIPAIIGPRQQTPAIDIPGSPAAAPTIKPTADPKIPNPMPWEIPMVVHKVTRI